MKDPLPYFRLHQQATKIRHLQPDIICLQEFNNPLVEHVYRKELASTYHFHVHRVPRTELLRRGVLCTSLFLTTKLIHPILGWICLGTLFHPYVFNFLLGNQQTGNAILTHKELEVVDPLFRQQCATIVQEFEHQQGDVLNWMRRRGYVELRVGNVFTVRNTHLNYALGPTYEQMYECMKDARRPSLLVGDFNTQDVTPLLVQGFKDTTDSLGNTYRKDNPLTLGLAKSKRIDFVFSLGVSIVDSSKLDMLSDHDALFVHFHLYPHAKRRLNIGTNTAKKHHMLATEDE